MKKNSTLALDNQLCFALYSASLATTQQYKKYLEPLGLTYTQYTIMLVLWERDSISLKYIADQLGQKSGSLTPVIKRMEKDGLVLRVRGLDDDRSLSIKLTEAGHSLKSKGEAVNLCIAESFGLGNSKIDTLKEYLTELKVNLAK